MSGVVEMGGGLMVVKLWRIEQDTRLMVNPDRFGLMATDFNILCLIYLTFSMFLIFDKFV